MPTALVTRLCVRNSSYFIQRLALRGSGVAMEAVTGWIQQQLLVVYLLKCMNINYVWSTAVLIFHLLISFVRKDMIVRSKRGGCCRPTIILPHDCGDHISVGRACSG